MNFLGSTKCKITNDNIGKNMLHLKITEVVLVRCCFSYIETWEQLNLFVGTKNWLVTQLL